VQMEGKIGERVSSLLEVPLEEPTTKEPLRSIFSEMRRGRSPKTYWRGEALSRVKDQSPKGQDAHRAAWLARARQRSWDAKADRRTVISGTMQR
ncbi:MAG: hypothetical protein ABJL67_20710, partial [Sulfitobacter sp.]